MKMNSKVAALPLKIPDFQKRPALLESLLNSSKIEQNTMKLKQEPQGFGKFTWSTIAESRSRKACYIEGGLGNQDFKHD